MPRWPGEWRLFRANSRPEKTKHTTLTNGTLQDDGWFASVIVSPEADAGASRRRGDQDSDGRSIQGEMHCSWLQGTWSFGFVD